jgi:hypothetical protein
VANAHDGLLRGHGLPSLGQAAELAVLSTAIGARATAPAPGARRERPATPGSQPHLLRLPADPCAAQATRGGVNPKTVWRVRRRRGWLSTSRRRIIRSGRRHEGRVHVSEPNRRGVSDMTSIRAWDGQKGRLAIMHERLCGRNDIGVAVCHAHDSRRSRRAAAGGYRAPVWGSADPRTRNRIPQRQWVGVHLASVSAVRASHGT